MNKELQELINKCDKAKITIISVNLVKGVAIVELDNGTPSTLYRDEKTQEWS